MSRRARRTVGAGVGIPVVALVTLVATAGPAGAHELDAGSLPAPTWLLGYLGAFAVVATALVLRGAWTAGRGALALADDDGAAADDDAGPRVTPGAWLALALLVAVLVAAVAGEDLQAANVAPVAVSVIWWVALPLVCLVAGNVLRVANPFVPLVAVLERVLPDRPSAGPTATAPPWWTAAAMLLAFRWSYLAYHRPGSPRAVAVVIVLYALAATLGGWWWGRRWLLTGEGFGALSTAVGGLLRRRVDLPAAPLLALVVAWLGTTAFDAVSATSFWGDVLGTNVGWTRTLLGTVGLVWVTGIVAAAALAVVRAVERGRPLWLLGVVGAALLPAAVGWFVAHDLTLLLFEGQNFLILLSDPLGRGWDLLGTVDHDVDLDLLQSGWVRAVQLAALLAGHVGAVVIAHDAALARLGRRRGMQVTWLAAGLAGASVVAAALLVLE